MIPSVKQIATAQLLLLALATASSAQTTIPTPPPPAPHPPAQTQPAAPAPAPPHPIIPRTLILLDPAHGGPDTGAHLSNNLLEKDITLAFAARLRALLSSNNFAVISTRTSDPATLFTTDQRAEIANHDRAAVCLVLHATNSGSGIHLFTSSLTPSTPHPTYLLHWDTAQAPSIPASRSLANDIGAALLQAKLPVLLGQSSVAPLDNLTCPAIAIELAPLANPSSNSSSSPTPVSDAAYQQHTAEAIAAALTNWRSNNADARTNTSTDGATR